MRKTSEDAANAQKKSRSLADVHDLRLTALLFDLVEAQGRVKAAETLGVSYGALARAADTGRLTGRMRDALTRHLLEGADPQATAEQMENLADLERRVAGLEDIARKEPEGEESQVGYVVRTEDVDDTLGRLKDEMESLSKRVEGLETRHGLPGPPPASEPVTERLPLEQLVVSLHPVPGDDEKRFGATAPLVAEWRHLREEYCGASDALAKLRAEEDLLELEMVLVGCCGVTLPPADYPWDRFDLEDQTRRRKRRLAVVRKEIRREEMLRRIRRVCTLGVWRS